MLQLKVVAAQHCECPKGTELICKMVNLMEPPSLCSCMELPFRLGQGNEGVPQSR